jgi:LPPG:FO 2-phospho-L-lactate transferase
MTEQTFIALVGGVGGAKLALGLANILAPGELTVVANTGDDFEHLGLAVSPDLDTVMYTLAGIANPTQGWGIADETWSFLDAMKRLGGDTWFRLGDHDLATHVLRTQRLRAGESLSSVTTGLCRSLGIRHALVPMSDQPVRTMVETDEGRLAFQDYFVRRRCAPAVRGFTFGGIDTAQASASFAQALAKLSLAGVIIAPSNPFVSIGPILALSGVTARLSSLQVPIVAVSPIIAGQAVKGPAGKMFRELGLEISALSVARHYGSLLNGLVVDDADAGLASAIRDLGIEPLVTKTVMQSRQDKVRLAHEVVDFVSDLAAARR